MLPFNPRDALRRIVVSDCETILDVSCGHGRNAIVVKCHNRPVRLIGFDIFRPYVIESKRLNVYDDLLVADVRCPPLRSKSVSVVYFTEAIEHLRKEDGKEALRVLETIATKRILVTTPIGFALRPPSEIRDGNLYQLHLSGWLPSEIAEEGYEVWGSYPRFLKGNLSVLLLFPPFSLINLIRLPLRKSLDIVAVKTIKNRSGKIEGGTS